jgi:hypothetical protein
MASFRTILALTVVSSVGFLGALPSASAQTLRATPVAAAPVVQTSQGFSRCPKGIDQYVDVMKQLSGAAAHARALADENPLLEPDAAYYESELAATKKCAPNVASIAAR